MARLHVLLVDDDPDDHMLTRGLLEDVDPDGYEFEAVSTYEDGRIAISENRHDVYMLDYRLGERNGLQLLKEAIQMGCRAPLILLTGAGDRRVDEAAIAAGAADYLVKGQISPSLMERVIRHALDRRRLEEERAALIQERTARTAAENAVRARDQFLANVAHELKTPVANIRAHAGFLRRSQDCTSDNSARFDRALDTIQLQANHLSRLVSQLCDLSLLDTGSMQLQLEPVNIAGLLHDVIADARPRAQGHAFSVDGPDSVMTNVDGFRMRQVLSNLVDNAIRFSPQSSCIEANVCVAQPAHAQVVIRDHGRGVPPERRAGLFERFHQSEPGDHVAGVGIGLFVSRTLVELQGGTLHAEFPDAGGTRFVVTVPKMNEACRIP
jgi:two-component system sensor histidine kinase/response regulator